MIGKGKCLRGETRDGKILGGSSSLAKWTPSETPDIPQSGLRMWLKSDVGANTTNDVQALNDELVRFWYNQAVGAAGGTRVTSLQTSGAGSPIWKSNVGGFPALQFTNDDGFNYTTLQTYANWDCYIVLAKDNTGTDAIITGRTTQFAYIVVRAAGGTQMLQAPSGATAEKAFAGYVQGQMMLIGGRGNGTNITARAGDGTTASAAQGTASQNFDSIGIYLTGGTPSINFAGYMYEYILYNKALSAGERTQVEAYLQTKYGVL